MLPKEDRKAMLLRLYNDDSPLMDHSKYRFLQKPANPTSKDHNAAAVADDDDGMKDEETPDIDLINDEPISDDAGDGEGNIGTAGLNSDSTAAGGAGKGVGAKEEVFGTSVEGGLDMSGQGGG